MRLHLIVRSISIAMLLFAGNAELGVAQEEQILARGQSHYQRYCSPLPT